LLCNKKFPLNISVKIVFDDKELFGILNNYKDGFYEIVGIVENMNIPEGSIVMTAGLGNIFPSGIKIGEVSSVVTDNFDLSKIVLVEPNVDFNDISYVTVVKR
jgi:rod shape-determining protein MreC